MTPIHSPETVQQVTNTSGLEPAVIAALITGGVAILVAIIGNLWSWYIARKTLADSQTFERERLDRLIQSESNRHKADLAEQREDRLFDAKRTVAVEMVKHLSGYPRRESLLYDFYPLKVEFSLFFSNELTELAHKLASEGGKGIIGGTKSFDEGYITFRKRVQEELGTYQEPPAIEEV